MFVFFSIIAIISVKYVLLIAIFSDKKCLNFCSDLISIVYMKFAIMYLNINKDAFSVLLGAKTFN